MSDGSSTLPDNTVLFEIIEDEVNSGLHPEGEFTKWANDKASRESRDVHSGHDFYRGYDTDTPRPNFMTSTPDGKATPFEFNSVNSLECISARNTPQPTNRKKLPVVQEEDENEIPGPEERQKPEKAKKEDQNANPLFDQLRALIQHLDVEQISLRKRQEQYFQQMNTEHEEAKKKFLEESRMQKIALRQREKELTERENRINKDESEKLASLKSRLKSEIDLKNQKQVEIFKLKEEKAALEGEISALKKVVKRRMSMAKRAGESLPGTETKPKNSFATVEFDQPMPTVNATVPGIPSSNRIEDLANNVRLLNLDFMKSTCYNIASSRNENEASTSSFTITPTTDQSPTDPLAPPLHEEVLPCGCLTFCDHNGIVREWTHSQEAFTVKWSGGGRHIQLNSPECVRVTFAADDKIYVASPLSNYADDCSGLLIGRRNTVQSGTFSTKCGRGLFRRQVLTGTEHIKYLEDNSLECVVGDILIRRFDDLATKVVIKSADMNFIYRPGKLFRMTHLNKEFNLKTPCLYVEF